MANVIINVNANASGAQAGFKVALQQVVQLGEQIQGFNTKFTQAFDKTSTTINGFSTDIKKSTTIVTDFVKKINGLSSARIGTINGSAQLQKDLDELKIKVLAFDSVLAKGAPSEVAAGYAKLNQEFNTFVARVDTATAAQKKLEQSQKEVSAAGLASLKQLDSLNSKFYALSQTIKLMPAKDMDLIKNTPQLSGELQTVNKHLAEAKKALDNLDGDKASAELKKAGQAFDELKAHTRDVKANLDTHVAEHKKAGQDIVAEWKKTAQEIGGATRQIGQALMNTGMTMSMYITAPIVAAGKTWVDETAKFGQGTAALKAVTTQADASASGFKNADDAAKQTSDSILKWSKDYTFSASEALKATLFIKEAGVSNTKVAEAIAKKSAALVVSTADMNERTAAQYVDTATRSLAITRIFHGTLFDQALATGKASEAMEIYNKDADVLAIVSNNSAGRLNQVTESAERMAPTLAILSDKYGMTMEQMEKSGWGFNSAMINTGILMDKGITSARGGTEAATGWRTALTTGKTALGELGVSLTDSQGKLRNQNDIMKDLAQVFYGTVKAQGTTVVATDKQIAANNKLVDSNAKLTADQLSANQRYDDQVKRLGVRSAAETAAYKAAKDAMSGNTAEVAKKTQALMSQTSVFDKLTPKMREDIMLLNKDSEASLSNASALGKLKTGTKLLTDQNGKLLESEKIRIATAAFGAVGMKAMIPLIEDEAQSLNGGVSSREKYTKAIAEGMSVEEMAKGKLDNFKDSFTILQKSIEAVMIKALGPMIDKYLTPLIKKIQQVVDWFDALDQGTKEMIVIFGVMAAAAGPIIFAFGSILFSIGMIQSGMASLTALIIGNGGAWRILATLLNPVTLAMAGIALIIAGVSTALIDNTNGIRDSLKDPINTISGYFNDLRKWLSEAIPVAVDKAKIFLTNLGVAFLKNIDWTKIFAYVSDLRTALDDLFKLFGGDANLKKQAEELGGSIGKVLAQITNVIIPGFIGKLTELSKFLSEAIPQWTKTINDKSPAFTAAIDSLVTSVQHLADAMGKVDSNKFATDMNNVISLSLGTITSELEILAGVIEHLSRAMDFFNKGNYGAGLSSAFNAVETGIFGGVVTTDKKSYDEWYKTQKEGTDLMIKQKQEFDKASADLAVSQALLRAGIGNGAKVNAPIEDVSKKMRQQWADASTEVVASVEGMNTKTINSFTKVQDALVGHSIVPDMVNAIIEWITVNLKTAWDGLWNNLWAPVQNGFAIVNNTLILAQTNLKLAWDSLVLSIKTSWDNFWNNSSLSVDSAATSIGASIAIAQVDLKTTWDTLITAFSDAWNNFWSSLPRKITSVLSVDVKKSVEDQFGLFKTLGGNLLDQVAQGITDTIQSVINAIVEAVKAAWAAGKKAVDNFNPFGGSGNPPPGKAEGGPVSSGRTYLVGERGPELFTPNTSGVILPNSSLAAYAGGSTINKNNSYSLSYSSNGSDKIDERDLRRMFEMMEMSSTLNPAV